MIKPRLRLRNLRAVATVVVGSVATLAVVGAAAAQSSPTPTGTATGSPTVIATPPAPATLNIQAGAGQPNHDVDLFLPGSVTIRTGTTVTWKIQSGWPEPHTVTFGTPAGDPTTPVGVPSSGPVQYDGTQSFSSGTLGPEGAPPTIDSFSVTFTKAGTYSYLCVYHPASMKGTVTVIDEGAVDSQSVVDARGQAQLGQAYDALSATDAATAPQYPKVTANANGTHTYTLQAGADTSYGVVDKFFSPSVNISAGDTVTWVNDSTKTPHTVTFNPQLFTGNNPFAAPSGPSGAWDGGGLVNSGALGESLPQGFPQPVASSFSVTFSKAGSYQYICLFHADEGMQGVVKVTAAGTSPSTTSTSTPLPPSTGSGVGPSTGNTLWLGLGILGVVLAMCGAGILSSRRR